MQRVLPFTAPVHKSLHKSITLALAALLVCLPVHAEESAEGFAPGISAQASLSSPDQPPLIWDVMRDNFAIEETRSTHERKRVRRWLHHHLARLDALDGELEGSRDYLYPVLKIVRDRGLPAELALIPFLESSYRPTIKSPIGAYGLWQFIPNTAKAYGLNRSWWHDERGNIEKSTEVALDYLVKLKNRFGDWLFAVAAYNYGQGRIARELRAVKKPASVWDLQLPEETKNHLAKWIALSRIIRNNEEFQYELPEIYYHPTYEWVEFSDQVDLDLVAEMARRDLSKLWELNPEIEQMSTPLVKNADGTPIPHRIRVPIEEYKDYKMVAEGYLPRELRERRVYEVQPGDTLETIAGKFNTRGTTLRHVNNLSSTIIHRRQRLEIPRFRTRQLLVNSSDCREHVVEPGDTIWSVARGWNTRPEEVAWDSQIGIRDKLVLGDVLRLCESKQSAARNTGEAYQLTHIVGSGDTLSVIARRFFISVDQLMKANDISNPDALAIGQTLVIPK